MNRTWLISRAEAEVEAAVRHLEKAGRLLKSAGDPDGQRAMENAAHTAVTALTDSDIRSRS